ncbi:phage tail protein [Pseudomonas sp. UFMG81]|uniref:phage tail protein n=1 Tax=Pseudomonas sp. UFMG81 TaxID=2745936 RepID=UPI001E512749|nr:tail fiber protein [Pseudomonas sp. UFMG81]
MMTTLFTAKNSLPFALLPTTDGIVQHFRASSTNTADASYAPDGLAAAPIYGLGGQPLQGNEIVAGGNVTLVSYLGPLLNNGALCWILLSCEGGAQQVANATHSQHAVTLGQLIGFSGFAPGDIKYSAVNAVPVGWLKADGAVVSRAEYAALFAAIGITYGAGDGATTFGLPDLRGEFIRGFDDGRGIDQGRVFGSRQKGSLYPYDTTEGIANGVWSASTSQNAGPASQVAMGVDAYSTAEYATISLGGVDARVNYSLPGLFGDRGYSGVTRPRNVAMLALIKY